MRKIENVIDLMIDEIPVKEDGLISQLKVIKQSCFYTAPEIMAIRWEQIADTLNEAFPQDELNEWQKKVVDIFSGKNNAKNNG